MSTTLFTGDSYRKKLLDFAEAAKNDALIMGAEIEATLQATKAVYVDMAVTLNNAESLLQKLEERASDLKKDMAYFDAVLARLKDPGTLPVGELVVNT
jgi:hypothetical protein